MKLTRLLLVAVAFVGASNAAFVEVSGTASGTFGSSGTSTIVSGGSTLSYSGSTFTGFLAPDFSTADPNDYILGIGNIANPGSNVDNLGSFTVTPGGPNGNSYTDSFTLTLTFTLPSFVSGTNPFTATANVNGTVFQSNAGGVTFNFGPAINLPNFIPAYAFNAPLCSVPTPGCAGPSGNGNLSVSINDLTVLSGRDAALTGTLEANVQSGVPEPTTYLMMGAGLMLLGGIRRYRNQ